MDFDTDSLVLLRRGPRAFEFSDGEDDETYRGVCVYRSSLEETRCLAEQDAAVQAGRLAVEVVTWLTEKGALAFPGARTTRKAAG